MVANHKCIGRTMHSFHIIGGIHTSKGGTERIIGKHDLM